MFKYLRSFIGNLLPEIIQMKIVIFLSKTFWMLRKYFLGVSIEYPEEFLENWREIKKFSSQDQERNFTIYQIIKLHNKIFENQKTNVIEFGVDRGSSLVTISKFVKNNTNIFGIDSFGIHFKDIGRKINDNDPHYKMDQSSHFTNKRFKNFDYKNKELDINQKIKIKNCYLKLICCHFPDSLNDNEIKEISTLKYSFVHFDFDLNKSTMDAIEFALPRLEKGAILLFDDYNFINQEGVKKAVLTSNIQLNRCIQNQSGQLICFT